MFFIRVFCAFNLRDGSDWLQCASYCNVLGVLHSASNVPGKIGEVREFAPVQVGTDAQRLVRNNPDRA